MFNCMYVPVCTYTCVCVCCVCAVCAVFAGVQRSLGGHRAAELLCLYTWGIVISNSKVKSL